MLKQLLSDLRAYSGIQSKQQIATSSQALAGAFPSPYPNGDDTAAMKTNDGYDLLATEGFLPAFVEKDPWFAGWCGVMVNVSDIAAMGGRPVGVVNSIWGQDNETMSRVFQGMVAASNAFQVPILGGHTNLDTRAPYLSVSILGKAQTLLSSFSAQPEQAIVAAIDLRGEFRQPFLNWNAATSSPAERLRGDLKLLPKIAEERLAFAAKDISQAGLLGTCLMLLESSNLGAEVTLDAIPKPSAVSWENWLRAFPSFGYLFTTSKENVSSLVALFDSRGIAASQIGHTHSGSALTVHSQGETAIFWDLQDEPLTGINEHTQTCSTDTQHA